ncbi:hypothetical protein [Cupriavidus sp. CuC1]|uniref:hypothetical protein n=1 Tax=Cupriavidus sp. CuC1 TaxID=3373131 RepID=UPI0037D8E3B0
MIAILSVVLCPVPEGKEGERISPTALKIRGAVGMAEGMFLALDMACAHMNHGWQSRCGNAYQHAFFFVP